MIFNEKDLEDFIFDMLQHSPKEFLLQRGLDFVYTTPEPITYYRQPFLGVYGRADIVGYVIGSADGKHLCIDYEIIELKKDVINEKTLLQAFRYASGLEKALYKMSELEGEVIVKFNKKIVLIGSRIELNDSLCHIANVCSDDVFLYECNLHPLTGLSFKRGVDLGYKEESNLSDFINN